MTTRLTTSEFIARAQAVHGDKYRYEFSVYQSAHSKIVVFCPQHGMYKQNATHHLKGHGCPACSKNKKINTNEFIIRASLIHGDKYDYTETKYINAKTPVKIKCKIHGSFNQEPHSHLIGNGCEQCSYIYRGLSCRLDQETFIKKAKSVHGNKYEYSLLKYETSKGKIKIICREHGLFEQEAQAHCSGQGCPSCATTGFDRTKKGFLYILRSCCGKYMKVGITNKPDQRNAQLSRATPFQFNRVELVEGNGDYIGNLEKTLLSQYQPAEFNETFDGHTEWRLWDDSIRNKLLTSKL